MQEIATLRPLAHPSVVASRILVVTALAAFAISCYLPCAGRLFNSGEGPEMLMHSGMECAFWSLVMMTHFFQVLVHASLPGALDAYYGSFAFPNLCMGFLPTALVLWRSRRTFNIRMALVFGASAVLALSFLPFCRETGEFTIGVGYYFWLASFVSATAAFGILSNSPPSRKPQG